MYISAGQMRVLDFDIENRPTTYRYPDPWAEITSIACAWVDKPKDVKVWLLGRCTVEEILCGFLELYNQADMVTGHYIRNHDLPTINEALMELDLGTLPAKLTQDTKNDLFKKKTLPASQKDLSEMLGIPAPKVDMSQMKWRRANRLTADGLELTYTRVVGDVTQHIQMREAMLERRMLREPKLWTP